MAVPLMDIRGQYEQLLPDIKRLVGEVIDSGRFILGPNVRALEEEVAAAVGYGHAVAVANGTDAIELGLQALGIGPGDEVVTTAYTFFATAEAIARRGATPVFADIDPVTLCLDPAAAEAAIDGFADKYGAKYDKAVACLTKDREALLAFFDFPAEHWDHLRTSNPIESVFATVRHRTVRTRGSLSPRTARLMVFKLVMAAARTWHKLKGENQLPKVVAGVRFRDGNEVTEPAETRAA